MILKISAAHNAVKASEHPQVANLRLPFTMVLENQDVSFNIKQQIIFTQLCQATGKKIKEN